LARWGLQYKGTRNGFWSPWWNPIAIQAFYDGSLPKKSKFVGHIIVDQVTAEVTLENGVLSAKNSSEKTPDFIARTTIQLEDSPPKKLKDFEISGDKEKAKAFLKALSFS